jgi:predicted MPP superfamily phosphohydrolase
MRRARFYLTLLALTLLPQVLAATDLVRWLQERDVTWLSLSVPGVLLLLNVPMAFEVLRRKRKARLPRALAAAVQTPWTAWWLGSIFYALLLLFWNTGALVARLLGADPQMPLWLALSPFALSLYGTLFGAHALRRERVEVPVDGLPRGWHGARIVQLSDLHSGRHVTAERLRRIARRAARLQPERGGDAIWLCGVDDPWSGRCDLRAALRERPDGAATVLLSHQPNTWPLAQKAGVHLQLSGHTHGGQVAMLWLHRSLSLARLITPFVAGLYRAGTSFLYVNRGAGSVMPVFRIGARPEVTELTLVPAEAPAPVPEPA